MNGNLKVHLSTDQGRVLLLLHVTGKKKKQPSIVVGKIGELQLNKRKLGLGLAGKKFFIFSTVLTCDAR
ncbi:unnamed protein product [Urochloa humidicola]